MKRVLRSVLIVTVILSLLISGISCSKSPISNDIPEAETPTPTPTLTEKPTPTTSAPAQLQQGDFPISITSNYQVTITNNSQSIVEVYKFTMTYDFGAVIGGGWESNELIQLRPGQSLSKSPVHSNVVSLSSVSFYIRANGQQVVVTYSAPTPTPTQTTESVPISKNDFLITIIPNRQVTVTNNSQSTVQVYKSSITYECYSYVQYNMPGKPSPYYGPIIRPVSTSDESTELKPGQSFSKTIRSSTEVLAIVSCIFYIRDNSIGQTIEVTYN